MAEYNVRTLASAVEAITGFEVKVSPTYVRSSRRAVGYDVKPVAASESIAAARRAGTHSKEALDIAFALKLLGYARVTPFVSFAHAARDSYSEPVAPVADGSAADVPGSAPVEPALVRGDMVYYTGRNNRASRAPGVVTYVNLDGTATVSYTTEPGGSCVAFGVSRASLSPRYI